MFEDVTDAVEVIELAQSAADRHGIPFYVVHRRGRLQLTSLSPEGYYLEKVCPARNMT